MLFLTAPTSPINAATASQSKSCTDLDHFATRAIAMADIKIAKTEQNKAI
jgi:hypothetical protein